MSSRIASIVIVLLIACRSSSTNKPYKPQVYDYQPDPSYHAGLPLRPMDTEILEALAKARYQRSDLADLFPGRPYLVRFIGDGDHIGLVLIDLERDGKMDERWQLNKNGDGVERRLGPVPFVLRHGHWVPY